MFHCVVISTEQATLPMDEVTVRKSEPRLVISREFATATPLGKSGIIFLFSIILLQALY